MGRSHETFGKKEVRTKKEKKRKAKEQKRVNKKNEGKKTNFDEMIAYVDEFGNISSTPPDPNKRTVIAAESIELQITKNRPDIDENPERKGIVTFFMKRKTLVLSVTLNQIREFLYMPIICWIHIKKTI